VALYDDKITRFDRDSAESRATKRKHDFVYVFVSNPDGSAYGVNHFVTETWLWDNSVGLWALIYHRAPSDEEIQKEIDAACGPGKTWRPVFTNEIPGWEADLHDFLPALRDANGKIEHDQEAAKAIYLTKHRAEAEAAAIEAQKQALMASYVAPDVSTIDIGALGVSPAVVAKP